MNIKDKALYFAVRAHEGQVRKAEVEKPMIMHPISVGKMLELYGFDDNVVAAGYLHDVIEDTDYTKEDIEKIFGGDICSLVVGASEEDKSLSWEERKFLTIKRIEKLDLRHRAILACDKIDNTEDLYYLFGRNGKEDFSSFNRGRDKKKWYWEESYKALVKEQDSNHPMFVRLKQNIDNLFYNKNQDTCLDDKFRMLYFKMLELYKIKGIFDNFESYVIEVAGFNKCDKINLINDLEDYFKSVGFKVAIIKNIDLNLEQFGPKDIVIETFKDVLNDLKRVCDGDYDIVLVDSSLFYRFVLLDRLYINNEITNGDYNKYLDYYLSVIMNEINKIIVMNCSCLGNNNSFSRCSGVGLEYGLDVFNVDSNNFNSRDVMDDIVKSMRINYLNKVKKRIKEINN